MIFLPDLSDGETSDNMANVDEEDDDEVVLNSNPGFNRYTMLQKLSKCEVKVHNARKFEFT